MCNLVFQIILNLMKLTQCEPGWLILCPGYLLSLLCLKGYGKTSVFRITHRKNTLVFNYCGRDSKRKYADDALHWVPRHWLWTGCSWKGMGCRRVGGLPSPVAHLKATSGRESSSTFFPNPDCYVSWAVTISPLGLWRNWLILCPTTINCMCNVITMIN